MDVQHSLVQEVIREQIDADIDEVTDGQVSWNDPITKFCENIKGIKITGLSRYFDANFYYRVPVIIGKPKKIGTVLAEDFQMANEMSPKPVRAILTGPLTLAVHTVSEYKPLATLSSRISFFGEIIREEIRALVHRGAKIIQIDEPSLPHFAEEIPTLSKIYGSMLDYPGIRKIMAIYFSPLAPLLKSLQKLPFDAINLDFSYDEKNLVDALLEEMPAKIIGFGILNARFTQLEQIPPLAQLIRRFIDKFKPESLYITPSTGLEYLPRNSAIAKTQLLNKIKLAVTEK